MKKLSLFLFVLTMLSSVFPQIPYSISGRVADEAGLPLPDTEVILEQSGSELKESRKTDLDGIYHFDCLAEGIYSLTFKRPGFIIERMENIEYHSLDPLRINRQLVVNPAVWGSDAGMLWDEPRKPLMIFVKDNQSSCNLENAQVVVSSIDGIPPKSPSTNLCGYTHLFLDPGHKYSVRISRDGFQEQIINFDMPDAAKKLEVRLKPIK
jgi:hypothetical protein